ncbi:MAG: hypothetical protein WEB78_04900 [Ilumatobacteraceae bacterium]
MSHVLGKRHVEQLLATYDNDPAGALAEALRHVLDRTDGTFDDLVAAAPLADARRAALLVRDVAAMDDLARELNETRTLGP